MSSDRLFTPRFFVMCGFTFTVFLSAFQLLPTAPFRILDRGGSTFAAGHFSGPPAPASALSPPFSGGLFAPVGQGGMVLIPPTGLAWVLGGALLYPDCVVDTVS